MLSTLRARARLLLRQLRSDDRTRSASAAARFARLATLAACASDPAQLARRARLKHALTVIALERGHPSWPALKSALERAPAEAVAWYPRGMGAFLNRWFARYEDARRSLEAEGGYLFPYREGTIRGAMRDRTTGEIERSSYHVMRVLRREPDGTFRVYRSIWAPQ